MGRRPKAEKDQYYIQPEELRLSVVKSQEQGSPTEEFAKFLLTIQEKVLQFPRFRGYPEDVKQELRDQNIMRWMTRGWKSIKPERNIFAYITQGCYLNMLSALERTFKRIKQHRDFLKSVYDELGLDWSESGYEEAEKTEIEYATHN